MRTSRKNSVSTMPQWKKSGREGKSLFDDVFLGVYLLLCMFFTNFAS